MADPSFDPRRPAWLVAAALAAAAPAAGLLAVSHAAAPAATAAADTLVGTAAAESLQGLGGADSIRGMEGDDIVNGNAGDDTVGGGPGNDLVHGGQGADMVNGGQGDDTVSGDKDNDTIAGGLGADRFLFDADSGADLITDFDSAGGDRIALPAGAAPVITDAPGGVVISLPGGAQVKLAGVAAAGLGTWSVNPVAAPIPAEISGVAQPPRPSHPLLLAFIVALAVAFVGLLTVGLTQLVRGRRDE